MEFKKTENDGIVIYELSGRLDTQSAPDFQAVLDEGFEKDENKIILDCKNLEYMSSAGLRTILYAKKCIDKNETDKADEISAQKGFLKLINVSDEILEVFEMTGFSEFLSINGSSNDWFFNKKIKY